MPTDAARMDKDALIAAIGQSLVAGAALVGDDWDGFALIALYDDTGRRLSGFRYQDHGPARPATPKATELGGLIDDLRVATRIADSSPWHACVLRIRRDTGRFTVEFEYDDADRWRIGPETLAQLTEQARPQP